MNPPLPPTGAYIFVCMSHMRKLHILLLLLRMFQVSSNTGTHMQHECCLVCNVFQSVANMSLPQENHRGSVWSQSFSCCGGLIGRTQQRGRPTFSHCCRGLSCCHRDQTRPRWDGWERTRWGWVGVRKGGGDTMILKVLL